MQLMQKRLLGKTFFMVETYSILQNHLPEKVPEQFFPHCEVPDFYERYLVHVLTPVKD